MLCPACSRTPFKFPPAACRSVPPTAALANDLLLVIGRDRSLYNDWQLKKINAIWHAFHNRDDENSSYIIRAFENAIVFYLVPGQENARVQYRKADHGQFFEYGGFTGSEAIFRWFIDPSKSTRTVPVAKVKRYFLNNSGVSFAIHNAKFDF